MPLRLYKNKRDEVEANLVDYMRKVGFSVYLMAKPCDALVGWRGHTLLVDFKTGKKSELTASQAKFNDTWKGSGITIIRTIDDINALRLYLLKSATVEAMHINRRNRTVTA